MVMDRGMRGINELWEAFVGIGVRGFEREWAGFAA